MKPGRPSRRLRRPRRRRSGSRSPTSGHDVLALRRNADRVPAAAPRAVRRPHPRAPDLPGLRPRTSLVVALTARPRTEAAYRATYVDGMARALDALRRSPPPSGRARLLDRRARRPRPAAAEDETAAPAAVRRSGPDAASRPRSASTTASRTGRCCASPGCTAATARGWSTWSARAGSTTRTDGPTASTARTRPTRSCTCSPWRREPDTLYLGTDDEPAQLGDVAAFLADRLRRARAPARRPGPRARQATLQRATPRDRLGADAAELSRGVRRRGHGLTSGSGAALGPRDLQRRESPGGPRRAGHMLPTPPLTFGPSRAPPIARAAVECLPTVRRRPVAGQSARTCARSLAPTAATYCARSLHLPDSSTLGTTGRHRPLPIRHGGRLGGTDVTTASMGVLMDLLIGFATILVVIAAGAALAHAGVLDARSQRTLGEIAFFVASPALMVVTISQVAPGGSGRQPGRLERVARRVLRGVRRLRAVALEARHRPAAHRRAVVVLRQRRQPRHRRSRPTSSATSPSSCPRCWCRCWSSSRSR